MDDRKKHATVSTDALLAERIRLLTTNPEQYYRENPRPRFGFVPRNTDEE